MLAPRPRLLEGVRRLEHEVVAVAFGHDLKAGRQAGIREAGPHRGGRMAAEVERRSESDDPAAERLAFDDVWDWPFRRESLERHRRRQEQIVSLEYRGRPVVDPRPRQVGLA